MERILAIDPGSKKIGFIIMEDKLVIEKGIILYKDTKRDLISILDIFKPNICIVEKGGVPHAESLIKRILNKRKQNVIQYDSVEVREELDLFDLGINNQNKKYILKKTLGLREYNNHIIDSALLISYHYKIKNKKGGN